MKSIYLNTEELIQLDIESLIPHFKSCTSCSRLKETTIYSLEKIKDCMIRKTFTTLCIVGCILKAGTLLI